MSGRPRCVVCGRMMVWGGPMNGWVCTCDDEAWPLENEDDFDDMSVNLDGEAYGGL